MRLLHRAPEVADRDCSHCQKYVYSPDTGLPLEHPPGSGRLAVRPPGNLPNCRTPVGCPKGTPENQRSLTPENAQVYRHFLECRAVGQFPDDALVRRNAALITELERQHAESRWDDFRSEALAILTLRAGG